MGDFLPEGDKVLLEAIAVVGWRPSRSLVGGHAVVGGIHSQFICHREAKNTSFAIEVRPTRSSRSLSPEARLLRVGYSHSRLEALWLE